MGTPTIAMLAAYNFLGDRISRSKAWLNIAVNYTMDVHAAVQVLRFWPSFLRPLALRFHPAPAKARAHLRAARKIIFHELEKRKQDPEYHPSTGFEDSLDWFREAAAGREWDVAVIQVGLSLVSTHTTGQLFVNTMVDLAAYPEYMEPLREEIRAVLEEDGCLKQSSLAKLKLMDSVIKETQRLNPGETGQSPFLLHVPSLVGHPTDPGRQASMHRVATRDIKLPNGVVIPRRANLMVSSHWRKDPTIYSDPEVFDGYRFMKMRDQPGEETRHQLTTPTPEQMGFGYGEHACPGRFIAANLIKILLAHLLFKYDWKLPEGQKRPSSIPMGPDLLLDKSVVILIKSREPDIDLAKLAPVA
jgi:cytochrome P450